MNTLLLGNGFNLTITDYPSWKKLLSQSGYKPSSGDKSKIPYTIAFEISFQRGPGTPIECDGKLKKGIQELLKGFVSRMKEDKEIDISLYKAVINLDFKHYLTTNYDNFLCEYLKCNGWKKTAQDRTEDVYSIRRYYQLKKYNREIRIWNIHGDVNRYPSMLVGYDQYCGSLWKYNNYLKGNYDYTTPGNHKKTLKESLKSRIISGKLFSKKQPLSWIDLFFTNNIHIIGLGLSFNEIDLWWILNYRARILKNAETKGIVMNHIYYYCFEADNDQKDALTAFNIEVVESNIKPVRDGDKLLNAKELYEDLIRIMDDKMKENQHI